MPVPIIHVKVVLFMLSFIGLAEFLKTSVGQQNMATYFEIFTFLPFCVLSCLQFSWQLIVVTLYGNNIHLQLFALCIV